MIQTGLYDFRRQMSSQNLCFNCSVTYQHILSVYKHVTMTRIQDEFTKQNRKLRWSHDQAYSYTKIT
ncbi:hypothetical protein Hanom_Chr15g01406061 [Helianthus anomalus]